MTAKTPAKEAGTGVTSIRMTGAVPGHGGSWRGVGLLQIGDVPLFVEARGHAPSCPGGAGRGAVCQDHPRGGGIAAHSDAGLASACRYQHGPGVDRRWGRSGGGAEPFRLALARQAVSADVNRR